MFCDSTVSPIENLKLTLMLGFSSSGLVHLSTSARNFSTNPFWVCMRVQQMCMEAGNCSTLMS